MHERDLRTSSRQLSNERQSQPEYWGNERVMIDLIRLCRMNQLWQCDNNFIRCRYNLHHLFDRQSFLTFIAYYIITKILKSKWTYMHKRSVKYDCAFLWSVAWRLWLIQYIEWRKRHLLNTKIHHVLSFNNSLTVIIDESRDRLLLSKHVINSLGLRFLQLISNRRLAE
jgi:hypothetical protein